jgi:DNA-binding transcriptional LysR family regulator
MKLRHLKYALETERAGSITKAAQNLYMAQPNLSNALKELEASVGITIFKRTSHGVKVTQDGREFLDHVKGIVNQVDNLETLYKSHGEKTVRLRIGSVRSSHVSHLVADFINSIPRTSPMKIEYRETTQFELLHLIESNELDLGMISYPRQHKPYFTLLMKSKNIASQPISERPIHLLMSANHPLAHVDHIDISMLADYTEVIHGDLDSPEMQYSKWMADAGITVPHRLVLIYDRGSMMDILSNCHDCYKWTNATHPQLLKAYNLVTKACDTNLIIDEVVVYSKSRRLTKDLRMILNRFKEMAKDDLPVTD